METAIPVKWSWVFLFGIAFLAACLPAASPDGPVVVSVFPTFTPGQAETPLPPTATASPTATATPTDTAVPTPTSTATLIPSPTPDPCWQAGGEVTRHTLATDLSPWPWEYRVYTPPCYAEHPEQRYPVLILIHGSTYTDSQWDDLGADETADRLIASGQVPPFIILMPRDRVWVEPEEDPFGDAVILHLIPWLDANYRTLSERSYRAIGGLSRGASWAVHLGFKHWPLFSAIGAHSLPLFVHDPARIRVWLDEIPANELPRIYLDIGDRDYLLDKAVWFENLLTEENVPHEWYLNSGRHEEAYWMDHLEQYLLWYTAEW